jgi:NADPH:quinone reductase-like Zn-dependent oxidoreductase
VASPLPAPGEALIRVRATGVTPSELLWYPTTHDQSGADRRGAVPGHEFSGVIESVPDGSEFHSGDEVYGMNDWFTEGATAELCCAKVSGLAPKPRQLTHVEAASIPISSLTAWQGLFDRAQLKTGERVLIHGGAGAVGVIAIQLARRAGADVITTASARNQVFLCQLGARQVIDYKSMRFEEFVRDVDVVFDAVGGETLARSWDVLKPNGRLVTIAASGETKKDDRTAKAFFIVEANSLQLRKIAVLLDTGELTAVIDAVVPFEEARSAYSGNVQHRRGCGKMVLAVTPQ